MDYQDVRPESRNYASLLQACLNRKALSKGKLVHAHIIRTGYNTDIFLETKLVIMYSKCGSLVDARRVLDEMPEGNVISWTAMIAAYSRQGHGLEAITLFYRMQLTGINPNQFTFASVLVACAKLAILENGKKVHGCIIRMGFQSDICVGSALINMYIKCKNTETARKVFDKMPERDVVSWTAMIAGYAQNGDVDEAFKLFHKMPERNVVSWNAMIVAFDHNGQFGEALKLFLQMQATNVVPDSDTFATVLAACANLAALDNGKEIHKEIIRSGFQSNVFVGSALVDMYVKCEDTDDAVQVFDRMPERNVVSWTAMISGYAQIGYVDEALKLFEKMPERNVVTWTVMITAYAKNGNVDEALKLFQAMPVRNVVSWNAMIAGYATSGHFDKALKLFRQLQLTGYAHNGLLNEALKLFQKMPEQNVVSWTAMISGYSKNGQFEEALKFFQQMQLTGVKPDLDTFASVLPACAHMAALHQGREVHGGIIRSGFKADVFVGSALVDMYAKCGIVEDACKVFDKMPEQNVVSWTAMIVGYALHGCGKKALQLFEKMQRSGMKPNPVTFVGVLSACCHAGLVGDGWKYFHSMSRDYYITPEVEHYCCMVDLLGRAGQLDEAQDIINNMPIKPDSAVWGSLLGACKIHSNVELGEDVAERLFQLDPKNAAHYVLLSNIYAAAGRWDDKEKIRKMMKDRRVTKMPGLSWIEVNTKVYVFLSGD
eukprot:Gb_30993 [translate_table: standard]